MSIGIGENILLARLASRAAKPNGSFHLRSQDMAEFAASLDIKALHGIGSSTKQKCVEKLGTSNLGDLLQKSRGDLSEALGPKTGSYVYDSLRGVDDRKLVSDKARQSVSTEVNYGIRFASNDEAEQFIRTLSLELSRRLVEVGMKAHYIAIKLMKRHPDAPVEAPKFMGHGLCDVFHKSGTIAGSKPTSDPTAISIHAWRLLKSFNFDPKELRGIGITVRPPDPLEKGQSTLFSFAQPQSPGKPHSSSRNHRHEDEGSTMAPPVDYGGESPPSEPLFPARNPSNANTHKRIARALAPREGSRVSHHSPGKTNIFDRSGSRSVSREPSRENSVDPMIFDEDAETPPAERESSIFIERVPLVLEQDEIDPPVAVLRRPVTLKQKDQHGNKIEYTQVDEVQLLLSNWIRQHQTSAPRHEDVQYFGTFLVGCVDSARSTDTSIEIARDVLRWWLIWLKKLWPETVNSGSKETVGEQWWGAFEEVRESVDSKIRDRFGGRLSLK